MISVITPSFNQSAWLKLAIASVADQSGVEVEHLVQDALSTDETAAWLAQDSRVNASSERDTGMYDAINRGLAKARGDICAYLNCDEQYLPGALEAVSAAFEADPAIDVLLAGTVVVSGAGEYLCSRPALRPSLRQLAHGRMYNLTSSIFFRRHLVRDQGLLFDPSYRVLGDLEWFGRVLRTGSSVGILSQNVSSFSDLGNNLAMSAAAKPERERIRKSAGSPSRLSTRAMTVLHRLHRFALGHYNLKPFEYSIYTRTCPHQRQTFRVEKPTGVWSNRLYLP